MKHRDLLRPIKRVWKPLAGIAGLGLMILYSVGACRPKTPGDAVAPTGVRPVPAGAEQITVTPRETAPVIDLIGTVRSDRSVTLSARLQAYVEESAVRAGDRVRKGDLLIRLDSREMLEQTAAAEATLTEAESEYHRVRNLHARQAATEQALNAAEASHRKAKAGVEQAQIMLSYATITAPMDGIVTERHVDPGDLASPGQALLTVYDPDDMRLDVPVPVRMVGYLSLGQEVKVRLDVPSVTVRGVVKEIVGEVDPASRTQRVKVLLPPSDTPVPQGTFGRLLLAGPTRPMLLVPSSAVLKVGQLELIHVVDGDTIRRRTVRTIPHDHTRVEVQSGLSAGESILNNPSYEEM